MIDIHFLGHAAFQLDFNGVKVLIDPFIKGNSASPVKAQGVEADYILVTHGHGDHMGDTVEIAKRTGAVVVSNAEICDWLENQGVKTHAQHLGGGYEYPFGYVKLTNALHGSSLPDGSYGGNPAGFLITTKEGKRLYFAGDTGLFGDMRLIGEEGINFAALPIGDNYTMGPDDALRAVKLLNPCVVMPIHYSTFSVIKQDAEAWAKRVAAETSVQVALLKPGDHYSL
ncbi:MAG: metal-dependent hydrolase [Anaerolineaceae bacterium]|nr:metal-dependent hydrolase [Anaerolineaceae bacterium]